ncbi:hypothetical protein [Chitinophaga deserti]|uniref:hypothetical protein n=1 Tax=Chitinophaga deserti TaxID=2164099 RepID=UPI000D6AAF52|nr:hypothetical protein [Chitinophaga deserti]
MTHKEFALKISKVPFTPEVYKQHGWSEKFIEDTFKRHTFLPKEPSNTIPECVDPILNLVRSFDVSNVEIGMVRFNDKIVNGQDYIIFGRAETDDLVISKITNEILLLESGINHVLYYCASNSTTFLNALLQIAPIFQQRGIDVNLFENDAAQIKFASAFGETAGGEKYKDFYRMLLGV